MLDGEISVLQKVIIFLDFLAPLILLVHELLQELILLLQNSHGITVHLVLVLVVLILLS